MAVVSDRKIAVANTSPLTALDEHFATSGSIAGWSTLGGYSATISWAGAGNIKLQTGVQNGNMAFTLPNSANVPYTLNFVNVNATGTSLKALIFDAGSGTVVSSTSLTGGLNTVSFNAPYSNLIFEIYEAGIPVGTSIVELDDISLTIPTGGATQYFTGEVLSATDYYSFGATMPGRNFTSSNYRYGFNGQEKDDEIAGAGNINTAEFWQYDTRLGRRWETDPIVKPWESPYACFFNSPIEISDPYGLDGDDNKPRPGTDSKNKKREGAKSDWENADPKSKGSTGYDGTYDWKSKVDGDNTIVQYQQRGTEVVGYYSFPTSENLSQGDESDGGDNSNTPAGNSRPSSDSRSRGAMQTITPNSRRNRRPPNMNINPVPIINPTPIVIQPPICNPVTTQLNFLWQPFTARPANSMQAIQDIMNACQGWHNVIE